MLRLALSLPPVLAERWLRPAIRVSTLEDALPSAVEVVALLGATAGGSTARVTWDRIVTVGGETRRDMFLRMVLHARPLIEAVGGPAALQEVAHELLALYRSGIVEPGGSGPLRGNHVPALQKLR